MSRNDERRPLRRSGAQTAGEVVTPIVGRSLPKAATSAAAPAGRRTLWVGFAQCPHCHGSHVHRARSREGLDGAVRAGCGRPYVLVVRRAYVPRQSRRVAS